MPYTPNANDPTQPIDSVDASTAAAEFRALKTKVLSIVPGAASNIAPVRQTVLQGLLTAGVSSMFSAGAGLTVNLNATTLAVWLAFANGFNSAGASDYIETLALDVASYWTLPASNTSYLSVTRSALNTLVSSQSLALPVYSDTYEANRQSVLQFNGSAGATSFIDDYGNTWTAQGGAKIQVNYAKFGTGGLGGAGATNALNGAADYIKSADFRSLGNNGSWSMRCWTKPLNALPGVGIIGTIMSAANATGFGANLCIYNNGGTIRFSYALSSDGATQNIANYVQGTTLPVLGTEYFVELTYDALAGVYRLYVNGAQEQSTASATRICGITQLAVGATASGANFYQGYVAGFEMLPYCNHPAGTAYAVPTAVPNIAAAGYSADWFDTQQMLMKSPSVASIVAGVNPTFVSVYKVYVGEADTSGAAVTASRIYAYRGRYVSTDVTFPGVNTKTSFAHNLGTTFDVSVKAQGLCVTAESGYIPGEVADMLPGYNNGTYITSFPGTTLESKNSASYYTGLTYAGLAVNKTNGQFIAMGTNWRLRMTVKRNW